MTHISTLLDRYIGLCKVNGDCDVVRILLGNGFLFTNYDEYEQYLSLSDFVPFYITFNEDGSINFTLNIFILEGDILDASDLINEEGEVIISLTDCNDIEDKNTMKSDMKEIMKEAIDFIVDNKMSVSMSLDFDGTGNMHLTTTTDDGYEYTTNESNTMEVIKAINTLSKL